MLSVDSLATGASSSPWYQLIPKVLDWPFLLFVLLVAALVLFYREIQGRVGKGGFSLKWGDGEITIQELSGSLDKELDPIKDDLTELRAELHQIGSERSRVPIERTREHIAFIAGPPPVTDLPGPPLALPPPPEPGPIGAQARVRRALEGSEYRWRSIERLAAAAGVPESSALEILRADPEVRLSLGKSGRRIAGLRSRVGDG
jgi:hypothetical protein